MRNAGASSAASGNKKSYGQGKSKRHKSTSRIAATDKASGRRLMRISFSSLAVQHLAEKLAHYLSETGNAYSEDPPGEIMKHRMQQAQERGHVGQHHCKAL